MFHGMCIVYNDGEYCLEDNSFVLRGSCSSRIEVKKT